VSGRAHADRPSPRTGLLLGVVAFQQPGGTAPQRAAYLRRLAAFPAYLDALAANAREGSPAAWSRLELEALREEWVAGGGDVRGFHDTLLGLGLLPLADLRAELQAETDAPR
jgi:uncharacterized protein (DUF885 family)